MHSLPGYALELNPHEMVWRHAERSDIKRAPLKKGKKMQACLYEELTEIKEDPALVEQFFKRPSTAFISDL